MGNNWEVFCKLKLVIQPSTFCGNKILMEIVKAKPLFTRGGSATTKHEVTSCVNEVSDLSTH